MSERDADVRALLEQFEVPAQSRTFFDELWELVQAREHARAVRWRRVSIVLACIAVAAITAAGVVAAPHGTPAVDQTLNCRLEVQGGIPVIAFRLRARQLPHGTRYAFTYPATVALVTGGERSLFVVQADSKGYLLNRSSCTSSNRRVAFSAVGLGEHTTLVKNARVGVEIRCLGPVQVAVHLRLTQDAHGLPSHVRLAAVVARTGKPLIDVDWSQALVREWSSTSRCEAEGY